MFLGRGKKASVFEGHKVLDDSDIKIFEATYEGRPAFFGIGLAKTAARRTDAKGVVSLSDMGGEIGGSRSTDREMEWHIYNNPRNMPGFIPIEKSKTMMAVTGSAVFRDASALNPVFEEAPKDIKSMEIAILFSLYMRVNASPQAHVPEEAILSSLRSEFRGFASPALRDLVKNPQKYVLAHPTRGQMTYQITRAGIAKLRDLKIIQ